MTPEQWYRVKEVFEAALEHGFDERSAFLEQACSGDQVLHSEVKALLSSYQEEPSFLEKPAAQLASPWFVKDEAAAQPGQQIEHYRLEREIGRGGMGIVYLAHDLNLNRPVALKFLPSYLTRDPERLRRFEQEARLASALNHPNVCVIHEIGTTEDGRHFIAMEYVEGITLRQQISADKMELAQAFDVAI